MRISLVRSTGFTLIELLIVVAIIAILAAIAVPNFLEAQIRAKVSRAKADMRSCATALEAYAVDNNGYPLDAHQSDYYWPWEWHLLQVTTPVAYMTSLPNDPFFRNNPSWGIEYMPYWYFHRGRRMDGEMIGYGWASRTRGAQGYQLFDGGRENYSWGIECAGPDRMAEWDKRYFDMTPANHDWGAYDSTNGTVSSGDIYYYGPGGGLETLWRGPGP